ncbi:MAG: hypothetical protein COA96_13125 [SAR86 cluster bacterium]|uniref:Uncharacterized protein n=1 Tax=SAR86 cluster bacterium TaxID=2030880 RepID=A0A2A5AVL5_9GAMM|nr:MAG: hypothetical protein COA96_13125 [SAR86 cluster bacterium]
MGVGSQIESNKEHLIANNFVPTGEFKQSDGFNFIFRACKQCNDEKSDWERHLSTITLLNSPARKSSEQHNRLALQKAERDFHPTKQGVLVKDSGDEFKVGAQFGQANISFGISAPPQADIRYIDFLAIRHIQGIFSLITSENPLTINGSSFLHYKYIFVFRSYAISDWGNPELMEIMKRVNDIPCYANIKTANGFFKVIMRRIKGDACEWFWALEWNKSLRIIGGISQGEKISEIFSDLPTLDWNNLGIQNGEKIRMRKEVEINIDEDILFEAEVENTENN